MDKYKCPYCGGKGEVEISGPECEYVKSCTYCGGAGEAQITIAAREYDALKTISSLTADDVLFLQELAHNLKTQETSCTATPVYFTIRERDITYGSAPGYAENYLLYIGDGNSDGVEFTEDELEDAIEYAKSMGYSECHYLESLKEISEFLEEREVKHELIGYINTYKHSGAFLTRAGANKHIEMNSHNLKEPIAYCHHAFRNPELEKLIEIIKKFDGRVE